MASFIKTSCKTVRLLSYVAIVCVITMAIYALAGGLLYGLLQAAGVRTEIAGAAACQLFPLVLVVVGKFAIEDFCHRTGLL